jgi:ribosomal protein S18 acetylase RimI-like enzyme
MHSIIPYRNTLQILDFENVVTLVREQLLFIGYQQTLQQVTEEITNSMKSESRSVLFVVYAKSGNAIGFAYANRCCGLENGGDYLWLNELYISKKSRKKGLGSELLTFVQTWAKKEGCVYLSMVTHPTNERAQDLYRSNGFELENLVWVDKYL